MRTATPSRTFRGLLLRLVLLWLVVPLVMIGIVASTGVAWWQLRSLEDQQQRTVRSIALTIDRHIDLVGRALDSVGVAAGSVGESELAAFMDGTLQAHGFFDTIYILDREQRIRILVPRDPRYVDLDMSRRSELRPAAQTPQKRDVFVSRPFVSFRSGDPTVYLVRSLEHGRTLVGEMSLQSLQREILALRGGAGEVTYVMDDVGTLLVHPDSTLVREQVNARGVEIFQRGLVGEATLVYRDHGRIVLGSVTRVPRTGWVVVDQIPLATALRPHAFGVGCALLASFGVWLVLVWNMRRELARHVAEPLVRLGRQTAAVARGEFVEVEADGVGPFGFEELAALESDFRKMRAALDARQSALRESEERFRIAFQTSLDAISITGVEDDVFVAVNDAFTKQTGWSEAEVLARSSLQLHLWMDAADRERFVSVVNKEGYVEDLEVAWRRKDGKPVSGLVSARRIAIRGHPFLLVTRRDVSEWKRAEEERERLRASLQQAAKMEAIGKLAGGVAHDFNNILSVILSAAQGMKHDLAAGAPMDVEALDEVIDAGRRARDLTRQLLTFARRQVIAPAVIDVNTVIRNMEKLLRRLLGDEIELVVRIAPDLWKVRFDAGQIEQIVLNLAANARDAMPRGGRLTIETRNVEVAERLAHADSFMHAGAYTQLSIRDAGQGMTPEVKAHVFEPFFTTKPVGHGTGLGLSTVYGIVQQNQGYILVESEPGQGTTFTIYLPRATDDAASQEARTVGAGLRS